MKTSLKELERHKKYYWKHRQERIAYASKWNREHKDLRKEISKRDNTKRKYLKRLWHERTHFGHDGILTEMSFCIVCGNRDDLIVHHLDGNNGRNDKQLNNEPSNLAVLCRSCHPRYHGRWGLKEVVSNA